MWACQLKHRTWCIIIIIADIIFNIFWSFLNILGEIDLNSSDISNWQWLMIYSINDIIYHILPIVSISNMNTRKSSVANNLRRKYKRLVIPTAKFSWNWIKYFLKIYFYPREVWIVNFCSWQFLWVRGSNAMQGKIELRSERELRLTMRVVFSCQLMHSST